MSAVRLRRAYRREVRRRQVGAQRERLLHLTATEEENAQDEDGRDNDEPEAARHSTDGHGRQP
jgi:hypothetical protein